MQLGDTKAQLERENNLLKQSSKVLTSAAGMDDPATSQQLRAVVQKQRTIIDELRTQCTDLATKLENISVSVETINCKHYLLSFPLDGHNFLFILIWRGYLLPFIKNKQSLRPFC